MKNLETIILIDDDDIANILNESVIHALNFCENIYSFPNAIQGLVFFQKLCSEKKCADLIVVDLKMPVLDGFDFLYEFEKMFESERKNVKIILLTSSNNRKDREKASEWGFDDYIVKPLNNEKITDIIERHF